MEVAFIVEDSDESGFITATQQKGLYRGHKLAVKKGLAQRCAKEAAGGPVAQVARVGDVAGTVVVVMLLQARQPFGAVMQRAANPRLLQQPGAVSIGDNDQGCGIRGHPELLA